MGGRLTARLALGVCCASFAGCVFAPAKYGPRGIVVPGVAQYDSYLTNCRSRFQTLEDSCRKWGNPSAIQIGHSGGHFVWKGQDGWVSAGSFSAVVCYGRHPKALRSYVFGEDVVRQDPRREVVKTRKEPPRQDPVKQETVQPLYSVQRFERVPGNEIAYEFVLDLTSSASGIALARRIKEEIRAEILSDYKATYTGERYQSIGVDFPKFVMSGGRIEGRAEIMQMRVMSLTYDQATRKGVIVVKIGTARFDQARRWVRENIEILARDKNVALMTGELPSEGKFYLGAERVKDGNILEIEFETE